MSVSGAVGAVFINGTVGAGKTTTADWVGQLLVGQRTPHAVIGLDALRHAWPAPEGDPFNNELELVNLRQVSANHRRAGAQRLVLAGVLEQRSMRPAYERAVAVPLAVVRLRADVRSLEARLAARHPDDGEEREWHLRRCGELHAILEAAGVDDRVIDVDDLPPRETAAAVLNAVGWASPPAWPAGGVGDAAGGVVPGAYRAKLDSGSVPLRR